MKKIFVVLSVLLIATPALAKVLVFKDGRRMEVRDYSVKGELVNVTMLDGEETIVRTSQVDLDETDRVNRPPTPTPSQANAEKTPSLVELARIERLKRERQREQEKSEAGRPAKEPTAAPETPTAVPTPEPTATETPVPEATPTPVPTATPSPQMAAVLRTPAASPPPRRGGPPAGPAGEETGGRRPFLSFIPGGNTGLLILAGAGILFLCIVVGIVVIAKRKKRTVVRPRTSVLAPKAAPAGAKDSTLAPAEEGSLSRELESMEFREERERPAAFVGEGAKAEPSFAEELKAEGPAFGGEEEGAAPSFGEPLKPEGRELGGGGFKVDLEFPHEVKEETPSYGASREADLPFREEAEPAGPRSRGKERTADSVASAGAAGIFRDEKDIQIRIDNEVYICPDVQTLKTWVSEGRVIENSEVLAPNGAWLLAGTIPDLEQSFELRRKNLGF